MNNEYQDIRGWLTMKDPMPKGQMRAGGVGKSKRNDVSKVNVGKCGEKKISMKCSGKTNYPKD